jgi:hypothetical protein
LVTGPDFLIALRCPDPVLFLQFGSPSGPPVASLSLFSSAHDFCCDFSFAGWFLFLLPLPFVSCVTHLLLLYISHPDQELLVPNPFATAGFVFGFHSFLLVSVGAHKVSILCANMLSKCMK